MTSPRSGRSPGRPAEHRVHNRRERCSNSSTFSVRRSPHQAAATGQEVRPGFLVGPAQTQRTIAEWVGDQRPDAAQRLFNHANWKALGAMSTIRRFAVRGLDAAARPEGPVVAALDESWQEKRGRIGAIVKDAHVFLPLERGRQHWLITCKSTKYWTNWGEVFAQVEQSRTDSATLEEETVNGGCQRRRHRRSRSCS
jgi:hypothetical protein